MFEAQPILIVEDECYVAIDLAMAVEGMNGIVVGPAATVAEALALIDAQPVAAAILDANLADRDVTPVAELLAARGVPFVIHTGTIVPPALTAVLPDLLVVPKPAPPTVVLACLLNEIRSPGCQRLLA